MPVTIARWKKIPERPIATGEVQEAFGIGIRTISQWTTWDSFRDAQVAVKVDGHYQWDKNRLLLWLIACGYFKTQIRRKYQLPDKEDARARLGIPPDARLAQKRG